MSARRRHYHRGIRAMEDAGVRAAMIDAIDAASHNA